MAGRSRTVRVAACQVLTGPDPAAAAKTVVEWLKRAAEEKIRLVAFPEGCLYGYTQDEKFWRRLKPAHLADAEAKVSRACRRLKIAAVVGSAHREGRRWFNSLAIFDQKGGLVGRYSKIFLAGDKFCEPGTELPVYRILGIQCCFLVCHDIRYPELVRLPVIRGARLCVYCSCESPLTLEHKLSAYRAMPISRAAENGIWLVMANTPADPANMTGVGQSHGNSKIVDPDGNVVVEAGFFEQRLVWADIDPSRATAWVAHRVAQRPSPIRQWINAGAGLVSLAETRR